MRREPVEVVHDRIAETAVVVTVREVDGEPQLAADRDRPEADLDDVTRGSRRSGPCKRQREHGDAEQGGGKPLHAKRRLLTGLIGP